MHNSLISIIVPVYKVEKYLNRCIDSIINQTYKNLEIILVDDGSPDNCGEICDEYAEKDNRVKVIHKKNGGVSSARNTGIDSATGEYIMFVDSDDYIEKDGLQYLFEEYAEVDILIAGWKMLFNGQFNKYIVESKVCDRDMFVDEYIRIFRSGNLILSTPWSKLYKRKIFVDNNLRFDEKNSISEDAKFNVEFFSFADNVKFFDVVLYVYNRDNSESATCKFYENYYAMQKNFYISMKKWMDIYNKKEYVLYQLVQIFYASFCHYAINCKTKIAVQHLSHMVDDIGNILFDNVDKFDMELGGGYKKYLLKRKWYKILIKWKIVNFPMLFKKKLRVIMNKNIYLKNFLIKISRVKHG